MINLHESYVAELEFELTYAFGNFPCTAKQFGVQTHYYRLPVWPVMCLTKYVMV